MQLTLIGAKSKASCRVRPVVEAPIAASIVQPLAIGFSQIDPVVNAMDDERSFVRYRAPILAVSFAANVRMWKVFLHLSKVDLFQRYCRQPLTNHEDDMVDSAPAFSNSCSRFVSTC